MHKPDVLLDQQDKYEEKNKIQKKIFNRGGGGEQQQQRTKKVDFHL